MQPKGLPYDQIDWDAELAKPNRCKWCRSVIEFDSDYCGVGCKREESEYYYHPANVII